MAKRSCGTSLLEFLEKSTRIFHSGDPLDIIYLSFAKAFDKVPHKRLLNKMCAMGIEDNIGTEMDGVMAQQQKTMGSTQWSLLGLAGCPLLRAPREHLGTITISYIYQ